MSEFEEGSEQFLAAVWYVMNDARSRADKTRHRWSRMSRWWYLSKVRKALDLPYSSLNYHEMREDLIDFANNFGRSDGGTPQPTRRDLDAMSEFTNNEEQES